MVFAEVLQLARAALDYLGDPPRTVPGDSFPRYFDPASLDMVVDAILSFFQSKEAIRYGIISQQFQDITFSYGVPLPLGQVDGQLDDYCDTAGASHIPRVKGNSGRLEYADPSWALIIMCLRSYALPDLPKHISGCPPRFRPGAPIWAANDMMSLSSNMFHDALLKRSRTMLSRIHVDDYMEKKKRLNPARDPPNGYGSWNTMRLRQLTKVDPRKVVIPAFNADSYTYFALEAYWSKLCKVSFVDPHLKDSNTYFPDAAISEVPGTNVGSAERPSGST